MITEERAWNSITGKCVLIHGLNSDPFLPYQKYGMQLFVFCSSVHHYSIFNKIIRYAVE